MCGEAVVVLDVDRCWFVLCLMLWGQWLQLSEGVRLDCCCGGDWWLAALHVWWMFWLLVLLLCQWRVWLLLRRVLRLWLVARPFLLLWLSIGWLDCCEDAAGERLV
jgi:hypothetical protein